VSGFEGTSAMGPTGRTSATVGGTATLGSPPRHLAAALGFKAEPIVGLSDDRPLGCEVLASPLNGDSFSRWLLDAPYLAREVWGMALSAARPYLQEAVATHVNVTASHLAERGFVEELCGFLTPPELRWLVIEVTEQEPVLASMQLEVNLAALRRSGVSIALDDFGEGFSNFDALLLLAPEIVKVRQPTIRTHRDGTELAPWFLATCRAVGVALTIVECVESAADRAWARREGFDAGQGFLWR